ncbi:TPA: DUF3742 family protein [Citrobacter freundii]|nr:DUF3742 family protein [Citrobacter freundii]
MKQNFGYRAGILTRRFVRWLGVYEVKLQQRGVPRWVTKMPLYLCIAAAMGLLLTGAFFIAGFLALMMLIAWYLKTVAEGGKRLPDSDEPEDGYNATGPEGPGFYYGGYRIDD